MPRVAEAARAARREQIIATGMACFARSGYHATTMADVAAQAGCRRGPPYLYFDSKEALFLALHEQWDCGAGQRVDAAIAALPDGQRQSPRPSGPPTTGHRPGADGPALHRGLVRADDSVAPGSRLVLLGSRAGTWSPR